MKDSNYVLTKTKSEKNNNGKWDWLNCAKAASIIAVLVDHSLGILYTNPYVQFASDYAVSLFIITAGMTSYISNSRSNLNWIRSYLKSIRKIMFAYFICSAICLIIKTCAFDFKTYVYQIIHFNAGFPLYFVSIYLQVMLTGRLLYCILKKCPANCVGYIGEIVLFGFVFGIASITTNHTQILDIYAGGGKVLGGTYLILFYLGMLMVKHGIFLKTSIVKSILIWGISSVAWFLWWKNLYFIRLVIDEMVPLGDGFDIPSVTIMVFAILTLFAIFGVCTILEKMKITRRIVKAGSWLGEHTLYIFMLHLTILHFWFIPYIIIDNIWIKRVVYIGLMVIIPLIIEYSIHWITEKIKPTMDR